MTPAENPRANESNFVLVLLARNAIVLPIPVARPANRVNKKASKKFPSSIMVKALSVPDVKIK
jgi:hypothetical protein